MWHRSNEIKLTQIGASFLVTVQFKAATNLVGFQISIFRFAKMKSFVPDYFCNYFAISSFRNYPISGWPSFGWPIFGYSISQFWGTNLSFTRLEIFSYQILDLTHSFFGYGRSIRVPILVGVNLTNQIFRCNFRLTQHWSADQLILRHVWKLEQLPVDFVFG